MGSVLSDLGRRVRAASNRLRRTARDAERAVVPQAAGRVVVSCAWCGRYCVEGSWIAAEGVRAPAVRGERVGTSHGMCPTCFERLMRRQRVARGRPLRQLCPERRTGHDRRSRVEPVLRDRRCADRRSRAAV